MLAIGHKPNYYETCCMRGRIDTSLAACPPARLGEVYSPDCEEWKFSEVSMYRPSYRLGPWAMLNVLDW